MSYTSNLTLLFSINYLPALFRREQFSIVTDSHFTSFREERPLSLTTSFYRREQDLEFNDSPRGQLLATQNYSLHHHTPNTLSHPRILIEFSFVSTALKFTFQKHRFKISITQIQKIKFCVLLTFLSFLFSFQNTSHFLFS